MQAPKSLRKPDNWQDFETLCKKLWGEIWDCQEIKKNGRGGQSQNGVDIYGVPKGETLYYGIQCKGKDEYSGKQFTENEILKEIEAAKNFKPGLKKLYFATTALKDVNIESFIRQKNIEHINSGLFEVHLFSWEDIVDLIDENRQTHHWYVSGNNFKSRKEVAVTFEDGTTETSAEVFFLQADNTNKQQHRTLQSFSGSLFEYYNIPELGNEFRFPKAKVYTNFSYFDFQIKMLNTGYDPIEEYHLRLEFEGEVWSIDDTNETGGLRVTNPNYAMLEIDDAGKRVKIKSRSMLVAGDNFISDKIFIKPGVNEKKVIIKWTLLSKDYSHTGELAVNIKSTVLPIPMRNILDDPNRFSSKTGNLYDFLATESDFR